MTLCDPVDCSPPCSSVHGILQASILEWAAMPSSRRLSQLRDQICASRGSCIAGRFFTTEPLGKPLNAVAFIMFCFAQLLTFCGRVLPPWLEHDMFCIFIFPTHLMLSKYFKIGFVVPAWEHLPTIKLSYLQVHSRFLFVDRRHEYLVNEQQCP